MSGAGFLRVGKLKGNSIIKAAAGHNKRSIPTDEKIDPSRSHLNYALAGPATAGDVAQLAKDLMSGAGLDAIRKDAVRGLELVFSLPRDHQLNERDYFANCVEWAVRYYGGVTLSVDVHLDEAAPHCHLILLPLVNGRMVGNKLVGHKKELSALQTQFHLNVASKYGLSKAPPKLTGAAKEAAVKVVLQKMRETGDKALQSVVWAVIRDSIESDPMPFLMAYGIELQAPTKKLKTFTQIMTGKGKGKAKEPNTIAFTPPENDQRLCSVAFAEEAPDQPLSDQPNADGEIKAPALNDTHDLDQIDAGEVVDSLKLRTGKTQPDQRGQGVCSNLDTPFIETTTRHRDCDQSPDRFHDGDYCPPVSPPARLKRQAADGWVNAALATRSTYNGREWRAVL